MLLARGMAGHIEEDGRAAADQGIVAQRAAEGEALAVGEPRIEQDHIRAHAPGLLEHRCARIEADDGVSVSAEEDFQFPQDMVLIAGDEHTRRPRKTLGIWHTTPYRQAPESAATSR